MINLIFDLDDTLYARSTPFGKAVEDVLGHPIPGEVKDWYRIYSACSMEQFLRHERGEVSLEESRILRIQNAMRRKEIEISREQAAFFQERYQYYQNHLELSDPLRELMERLAEDENVRIGILTNGPTGHQKKKILALGLQNWIPEQNIAVSEEIGFTKPDVEAFRAVERRMQIRPENTYMIGDSIESDIRGAQAAGWRSIYYSPAADLSCGADFAVRSETELRDLLIGFLKE